MYYRHSVDTRRTQVPFYICDRVMLMLPPNPIDFELETDGKYHAQILTEDKGYSLDIAKQLFKALGYDFLPTKQKDLKKDELPSM